MSVAGKYECTLKSPMGPQKSVLTLNVDGNAVTGSMDNGPMGVMDILEGKTEGNTANWSSKMTKPIPATLAVKVTVEGDALTGSVVAGSFPPMQISGKRIA